MKAIVDNGKSTTDIIVVFDEEIKGNYDTNVYMAKHCIDKVVLVTTLNEVQWARTELSYDTIKKLNALIAEIESFSKPMTKEEYNQYKADQLPF